jgi:pimeloyl-ACP methyl ester carboxylesterase
MIRRISAALLLLLLAAAAGVFFWLPKGSMEGAALLARLAAGPGSFVASTGMEVLPEQSGWIGRGGTFRQGDIYRPRGTTKAVLILIPGGSPQGRQDVRLVLAATALAKAGFIIMVPEITNFRQMKVEAGDIALIEEAILAAADLPEGRRVGLVAASYALPATIKAALSPETRDLVSMVVGIGGLYDSISTARHVVTARINPFSTWWFLAVHSDLVESPADRTSLQAIARRKLQDPAAAIDDLTASLSPEGASVLALATAPDAAGFDDALNNLPPELVRAITGIGLTETPLDELAARVLLVHGANDPIVPPDNTEKLIQALRPGQGQAFILPGLTHADPADLSVSDLHSALAASGIIMQWRDGEE